MRRQPSYWAITRSPFYSFVFTLPLFGLYEVMVLFLSRDQILSIRNGADALIRQFLAMFGIWGMYVLSISFIFGFVLTFLWQKRKWRVTSVRGDYLLWMLVEGTVWGNILYIIMRFAPQAAMFPTGKQLVQQIVLAIGAGLYEEFLFRVLLISSVSVVLGVVFQWTKTFRLAVAVVISACLFSGFHFLGAFGEAFELRRFLYRASAGVFLGTLYVARGFGITAYAHMVYDLIVVISVTT